jgi:hypothetical protein
MQRNTRIVIISLSSAAALLLGAVWFGDAIMVKGQALTKDPLPINGQMVNLTEDIDIAIDPNDALPSNGTQSVDTKGITDVDINDLPFVGRTVVIANDSVTVTSHPVTIGK